MRRLVKILRFGFATTTGLLASVVGVLAAGSTVFLYSAYPGSYLEILRNASNPATSSSLEKVHLEVAGYVFEVPKAYLWYGKNHRGGKQTGIHGHAFFTLNNDGTVHLEPFTEENRSALSVPGTPNQVNFTVIEGSSAGWTQKDQLALLAERAIPEADIIDGFRRSNDEIIQYKGVEDESWCDEFLVKTSWNSMVKMYCSPFRRDYVVYNCQINYYHHPGVEYSIRFKRRHFAYYQEIIRDTHELIESFLVSVPGDGTTEALSKQ